MLGTASPEALKYDFEKSLQPGNYETENCDLAKKRLNRTTLLLKKDLYSIGIKSVEIINLDYEELQLTQKSEVQRILRDHSLLNGMRYVIVTVKIRTEKLEITPATAPLLLPFWLMGLYGIYFLFLKLFRKRSKKTIQPKSNTKFPWLEMLIILTSILSIVALVYYLLTLLPPFPAIPKWLIMKLIKFLVIAGTLFVIHQLIKCRKEIAFFFKEMWKALMELLEEILTLILKLIFWILFGIVNIAIWIENFIKWWHLRTNCQKFVLILLLENLVFFTGLIFGWWHLTI